MTTNIEAVIRRLVREEITKYLADLRSGEYSSESLPPLTSRRSFHERCRSGGVPGARKEGRSWFCARADWHRARERQPPTPTSREPSRAAGYRIAKTDVELADEMIRASGYRKTKKK